MAIVFLFDIDGVLIEPFGYRHAMRSTLEYYYHQMGLPTSFLPLEDEIGYFEAHRITSEWDMIPICLAGIFDQALQANAPLLSSVFEAIQWIKSSQPELNRPDYRAIIDDCARLHTHQDALADRLLLALRSQTNNQPFKNLARQPLIEALLANTRNFALNEVTRTFQNHVLGEQTFQQIYPQLPRLPLLSSLEKHDRSQIDPSDREHILALIKSSTIRAAAMTLRPNLYPANSHNSHHNVAGYSPEAEIAIHLTSLECLPVAGYGTLLYLAEKYHLLIDQIVKPSALHALVGFFLALRNSTEALDWAYKVYTCTHNSNWQTDSPSRNIQVLLHGKELALHVFEDSPNGIQSAQSAVEILRAIGVHVDLHAWGISSHPDKQLALTRLGATVATTTEEALHLAFQTLSG